MSAQDLEQRARELLAQQFDLDGEGSRAAAVRRGCFDLEGEYASSTAIRAIVAALRQQPAAVVDDAMVQRALNAKVRNWPVRQLFDSDYEARIAMRAALTVALAQGVQS